MSEHGGSQGGSDSVIRLEKTLLEKWSADLRKAGVDTRPLTRRLSTLLGSCTVARGHLATLQDKLSRTRGRSRNIEEFLIQELFTELWNMENELSSFFDALKAETASSSSRS